MIHEQFGQFIQYVRIRIAVFETMNLTGIFGLIFILVICKQSHGQDTDKTAILRVKHSTISQVRSLRAKLEQTLFLYMKAYCNDSAALNPYTRLTSACNISQSDIAVHSEKPETRDVSVEVTVNNPDVRIDDVIEHLARAVRKYSNEIQADLGLQIELLEVRDARPARDMPVWHIAALSVLLACFVVLILLAVVVSRRESKKAKLQKGKLWRTHLHLRHLSQYENLDPLCSTGDNMNLQFDNPCFVLTDSIRNLPKIASYRELLLRYSQVQLPCAEDEVDCHDKQSLVPSRQADAQIEYISSFNETTPSTVTGNQTLTKF